MFQLREDYNRSAPLSFSVLSHNSSLNAHHVPSAAGCFTASPADVSWDVSVQRREEGVCLSEGTAGLVAGAPPGLVLHCFPLFDLHTQSEGLIITQHHPPLHFE